MVFCIRYVNEDNDVNEDFIGYVLFNLVDVEFLINVIV